MLIDMTEDEARMAKEAMDKYRDVLSGNGQGYRDAEELYCRFEALEGAVQAEENLAKQKSRLARTD